MEKRMRNIFVEFDIGYKTTTQFRTGCGVAQFVYDTTLQSVPINETEKRIEESFYNDLEMETV